MLQSDANLVRFLFKQFLAAQTETAILTEIQPIFVVQDGKWHSTSIWLLRDSHMILCKCVGAKNCI